LCKAAGGNIKLLQVGLVCAFSSWISLHLDLVIEYLQFLLPEINARGATTRKKQVKYHNNPSTE
jgi:hypothetical protein